MQCGSWQTHPACSALDPGHIPLDEVWMTARPKVGAFYAPLSVCAFNLVSAWCLSCHRFQGQTVPKLCMIGHTTSEYSDLITSAQYYYVAWSRVREQADLFMNEPMPENPEYYSRSLVSLLHEAKLQLAATRTRLVFAAWWGSKEPEVEAHRTLLEEQKALHHRLAARMTAYLEECQMARDSPKKRKKTHAQVASSTKRQKLTPKRSLGASVDSPANNTRRSRRLNTSAASNQQSLVASTGSPASTTRRRRVAASSAEHDSSLVGSHARPANPIRRQRVAATSMANYQSLAIFHASPARRRVASSSTSTRMFASRNGASSRASMILKR